MQDKELYQNVLGIKNPWSVTEVNLEVTKKSITIIVEHDKTQACKCPNCGKDAPRYDHNKRRWRHLDTCQMQTIIECDVPRIECKEHGIKQITIPWAESNSHYTAMFEALAINWLKEASISAVAKLLNLSWDQVAGIQERAVERGLKRRKIKPLKNIGIDETSFQKHHEYVTVILDKDNDIVLDILDDRKAETLGIWLKNRPKRHVRSIKTVSMDMWDPFILAVRNSLVDADNKICFDRFHVAQYFNKALDKVRAEEHRSLSKIKGKNALTGTKHKWLRNSSRIDNRSRREFMLLTRSALKTARAWAIKELASQLWNFVYRGSAEKAWLQLLSWISRCRLAPVQKIGRMVKRYLWGILNSVIAQTTNAMAEAKNARIQRIKNMACGFRNRTRFRMAILFHLGGLNLMPKTLENHA